MPWQEILPIFIFLKLLKNKMKILMSIILLASAFNPIYGQTNQSQTAQGNSGKTKSKVVKVFWRDKSKPVRQAFEAIFAKQIADYKTQFESVKRGEKLKPDCAPDFVLKRPNGAMLTCEQITAERQAKFERIKAINYLKIVIGNIELNDNEAIVFTTQNFSRIVPGSDGKDYTIVTDGTIHKEFWIKNDNGWQSKGFQEVRQGTVTVDEQPFLPSPVR